MAVEVGLFVVIVLDKRQTLRILGAEVLVPATFRCAIRHRSPRPRSQTFHTTINTLPKRTRWSLQSSRPPKRSHTHRSLSSHPSPQPWTASCALRWMSKSVSPAVARGVTTLFVVAVVGYSGFGNSRVILCGDRFIPTVHIH